MSRSRRTRDQARGARARVAHRRLPRLRDGVGGLQVPGCLPRRSVLTAVPPEPGWVRRGAQRPVSTLVREQRRPDRSVGRGHARRRCARRLGVRTLELSRARCAPVAPRLVDGRAAGRAARAALRVRSRSRLDLDVPARDPHLRRPDAPVLDLHADELLPHDPVEHDRGRDGRRRVVVHGVQEASSCLSPPPRSRRSASSTCSGSGTSF